jgi:hypothetical protein
MSDEDFGKPKPPLNPRLAARQQMLRELKGNRAPMSAERIKQIADDAERRAAGKSPSTPEKPIVKKEKSLYPAILTHEQEGYIVEELKRAWSEPGEGENIVRKHLPPPPGMPEKYTGITLKAVAVKEGSNTRVRMHLIPMFAIQSETEGYGYYTGEHQNQEQYETDLAYRDTWDAIPRGLKQEIFFGSVLFDERGSVLEDKEGLFEAWGFPSDGRIF